MRKLSAIPTLLEKLSGNMTIDLNDTKSLTEDTVINGKQVLPSALVDDIKRLAEALQIDFAFPTQTVHLEKSDESAAQSDIPEATQLIEIAHDFGPKGTKARPEGLWVVKE